MQRLKINWDDKLWAGWIDQSHNIHKVGYVQVAIQKKNLLIYCAHDAVNTRKDWIGFSHYVVPRKSGRPPAKKSRFAAYDFLPSRINENLYSNASRMCRDFSQRWQEYSDRWSQSEIHSDSCLIGYHKRNSGSTLTTLSIRNVRNGISPYLQPMTTILCEWSLNLHTSILFPLKLSNAVRLLPSRRNWLPAADLPN